MNWLFAISQLSTWLSGASESKWVPGARPHGSLKPPAASRAVQMVSGASRALVATILPFYKFSWPPIGRAAMPHSQNLNGRIHAHSFPRLLSFFGSAATPCSVAGVAASPFLFFCICRLCLRMLLCLRCVSWHGPWASSDAIDGHARGEKERPRACPATEGNPKP